MLSINNRVNIDANNKKINSIISCSPTGVQFYLNFHWWCIQSKPMSFRPFPFVSIYYYIGSFSTNARSRVEFGRNLKMLINLISDNSACIRLLIAFVSSANIAHVYLIHVKSSLCSCSVTRVILDIVTYKTIPLLFPVVKTSFDASENFVVRKCRDTWMDWISFVKQALHAERNACICMLAYSALCSRQCVFVWVD